MSWSFRVTFTTGEQPQISELTGDVPAGIYQVSGHEGAATDTHPHTISIVRHDDAGQAVIGASGYGH